VSSVQNLTVTSDELVHYQTANVWSVCSAVLVHRLHRTLIMQYVWIYLVNFLQRVFLEIESLSPF